MNIVLGVTGSIAAYKSPDLVRRLREADFNVRVVMTKGGQSFITPLTMQAVSGNPVTFDLLDPQHEAGMGHIELARWADLILVAPVSANSLAKLAGGFADDLLSAMILATERPVMLVPGMNRLMWANPATKANIATLMERGFHLLEPAVGSQACGEVGQGRMPEPLAIRDAVLHFFRAQHEHDADFGEVLDQPLRDKKIVITAGPTIEEIDPVRYISNYSSGKMGYALAEKAYQLGADVTLISGPVSIPAPKGIAVINVKSADEMMSASETATKSADIFIAAAAVADYSVVNRADRKIKKTDDSDELTLKLKKNPDILATISKGKKRPALCIGFAAETDDIEENAKSKLQRKNVDMICLNDVSGGKVFGSDQNQLWLFTHKGEKIEVPFAEKNQVAMQILQEVIKLFPEQLSC